ncbi:aldehyde dehydrogenase domain-containing protein [Fusarium redolens]|uniref:aldehyde dehydrogenase (NAD(+)) n=1 Tax=Fusarium redolens TaxID=48865 RepID=A0A9P9FYP8_FUSRE|nr:aldehyde dehydrogenase domain-containing protein [Fusarium redolens]KAH7230170.1 aldehyde dehydrogenase domain-containing protein [Fusarium redolens]
MSKLLDANLFINNELVPATCGQTLPLYSPVTGEQVAVVSQANERDIDSALDAAREAYPIWQKISFEQRAKLYNRLANLILQHRDELHELEAMSMGKPYGNFAFDNWACASLFRMYANMELQIHGKSSLNTPGMINLTLKQPYGVVAAIIPWNVSLIMFAMKVAPALVAGNAIIVKSSEKAPPAVLKVAELIKEAGFSAGLVNVISGDGRTGDLLARNMRIGKISVTGSVATGKKVAQAAAASNLKNVTLELGGKSPAVIFADADLDTAVAATEISIHVNSGQHCQGNSRILIEEFIIDTYLEKLIKLMSSRKIGDPTDKPTFQGPQGDKQQQRNVLELINEGKQAGKLVYTGQVPEGNGAFAPPTIFKNVGRDSRIFQEEVFGPVVIANSFKTEEEAIKIANNTQYGLHGKSYVRSPYIVHLSNLEVTASYMAPDEILKGLDMPVGGWKQSGIGSEMHMYSVENFLQTKAVCFKHGFQGFGGH